MTSAVIFQIQSIIIFSLLCFGIYKRRQRDLHVKTMSTVIVWDILLVLQIELSRSAIDKASQAIVNPAILNVHVTFAVLSVVFYLILAYTGRKLLKGDHGIRSRHRFFGWSAFVLRALTLITSFFAVAPKN